MNYPIIIPDEGPDDDEPLRCRYCGEYIVLIDFYLCLYCSDNHRESIGKYLELRPHGFGERRLGERIHIGRIEMPVEGLVHVMIEYLHFILEDAAKHDKGNSAAGTRVRKAMQQFEKAAQDVCLKVQADNPC